MMSDSLDERRFDSVCRGFFPRQHRGRHFVRGDPVSRRSFAYLGRSRRCKVVFDWLALHQRVMNFVAFHVIRFIRKRSFQRYEECICFVHILWVQTAFEVDRFENQRANFATCDEAFVSRIGLKLSVTCNFGIVSVTFCISLSDQNKPASWLQLSVSAGHQRGLGYWRKLLTVSSTKIR